MPHLYASRTVAVTTDSGGRSVTMRAPSNRDFVIARTIRRAGKCWRAHCHGSASLSVVTATRTAGVRGGHGPYSVFE